MFSMISREYVEYILYNKLPKTCSNSKTEFGSFHNDVLCHVIYEKKFIWVFFLFATIVYVIREPKTINIYLSFRTIISVVIVSH